MMESFIKWGLGKNSDVRREYGRYSLVTAFLSVIALTLADQIVGFVHVNPLVLGVLAPVFLLSLKGIDDGAGPFIVFGIIYSFGVAWAVHMIVTRWMVDSGQGTLVGASGFTVGFATAASLLIAVFAYACYGVIRRLSRNTVLFGG